MKSQMSALGDRVVLARVRSSVQLAQELCVQGAVLVEERLRHCESLADIPDDLRVNVCGVLTATEQLLRADRPRWAAAIAEEVTYLAGRDGEH